MMNLELSDKEIKTLKGILMVEHSDLEELIESADSKDKKELKEELKRVISIESKLTV